MWPFSKRTKLGRQASSSANGGDNDKIELVGETPLTRLLKVKEEGFAYQRRLARDVPQLVQAAIIEVCERHPEILTCTLVEFREPDTGVHDLNLFVNLTLIDESQLVSVAEEISRALLPFPDTAESTFIVSMDELAPYVPYAIFKRV